MSSTEPTYSDSVAFAPDERESRETEQSPDGVSRSAGKEGRVAKAVQSTPQLLRSLEVRLDLLRARGLPIPDLSLPDAYARHLASHAFMLTEGKETCTGYDVTDSDGIRYRIVGRKGGREAPEVVVPGIPDRRFDRIILGRFGSGYGILFAGMARVEPFLRAAEYREDSNDWVLGAWDPFWTGDAVDDVTVVLRIAAAQTIRDDDFPLIQSFSTPPSYPSRQPSGGLIPPQA